MQLAELIDSNSGGWNRRVIEETFVLIDDQKIKVMFGFGENKRIKNKKKKIKRKIIFLTVLLKGENKVNKKIGKKIFLPDPSFFIFLI